MLKPPTTIACETLLTELPEFFLKVIGDSKATFSKISSPSDATQDSAVFCATPKAFTEALASQAKVLIVGQKSAADAEAKKESKTIVVANNVERAMATAINRWFLQTPYTDRNTEGIHPSAIVHPSAKIGNNVRIAPHVIIAESVVLGDDVFIGANSVIEANAKIGNGTVIHPLVYIGHSTQLGNRCEVLPNSTVGKEGYGYAHDEKGNHYRIPHQGKVVLEDDVHVGANCAIDRGTFGETRISAGCKLDNQVHIAHNCKIGRNGLLTARFAMAGSSTIGNNFIAGGNTMVSGHITIADQVQVAGFSGISGNVPESGQYGGYPLQPLKTYLKNRALMGHLDEMRKQLNKISRAVFPEDKNSESKEN